MHTVFHAPHPDQYRVADAKVRNLLADDTVDIDDVAVVIDRGGTIDAAVGDLLETTEAIIEAGGMVKICSNALGGADVDEVDLPAGTEVVSSGVGELTRLQADDWAYIRP